MPTAMTLPAAAERALAEAERLLAAGRLPEAAAAYRRAEALVPGSGLPAHRLAEALQRARRPREALVQRFVAWRREDIRPFRRALVSALAGADLAGANPAMQESLARLLRATDVSPLDVAPAALSALQPHPGFAPLLAAARSDEPAALTVALATADAQALLAHPLWQALLEQALQTSLPLEALLTRLRRLALAQLGRPDAPGWLLAPAPGPLAALALQASLGAQAWGEEAAETAAVAALGRRLADAPPPALDPAVLLYACYRTLPADWLPAEPADAALARVLRRLVEEPRERLRLAASLPGLTPVTAGVSAQVRDHYDANPYPRWLATNLPEPRPLAEVLRRLFPGIAAPADTATPRVLIAGCGTGEQAVRSASRFAGADLLAVDLSRSALAYAQQRAAALGLGGLRFAQADILALSGLAERFDLVECVGVLHHLADPFVGWQILRGLLHPGGLMRIALYSRRARAPLAEARRMAGAEGGGPVTPERLRAARTRLLADPGSAPAAFLLRFRDAWDLDGLRDLLFHAHERDFTLPEIAAMLAALRLEFLGFELDDAALRRRFREGFAQPGAERDLAAWDRFESAEPESFLGMYRFWCRALPG